MTAVALCPSCSRKHRTSKVPHALTKRQRQVYDVVCARIRLNGYSPTFRELGRHFNLSITAIWEHVHNLNRLGLVILKGGKSGRIVGVNPIPGDMP